MPLTTQATGSTLRSRGLARLAAAARRSSWAVERKSGRGAAWRPRFGCLRRLSDLVATTALPVCLPCERAVKNSTESHGSSQRSGLQLTARQPLRRLLLRCNHSWARVIHPHHPRLCMFRFERTPAGSSSHRRRRGALALRRSTVNPPRAAPPSRD